MKYCTNCGKACEDFAMFCDECGTKLEVPAAQPVNPAPAAVVSEPAQTEPAPVSPAAVETPVSSPVISEPEPAAPTQPVNETPEAPTQPVYETPAAPAQPVCETPVAPVPFAADEPASVEDMIAGDNIRAASKAVSGPAFLFAIIGFAASFAASVISLFSQSVDVNALFDSYANKFPYMSESLNSYKSALIAELQFMDKYTGPVKIVSLVFLIPALISLIGMLVCFAGSKKSPMKTAGFTMMKTDLVFKMVLSIIVEVCVICCFAALIAFMTNYRNTGYAYIDAIISNAKLLLIVIAVIMIIIITFMIIYLGKFIATINTAKKAASAAVVKKNKASGFVAVINIILAVFSALGLTRLFIGGFNTISLISSIAGIVFYLSTAVIIFSFKKKVLAEK